MNIEQIRAYCLGKFGVTESFPFDNNTLVFKVKNKMFALLSLNEDLRLNLKCEPEKAYALRERYPAIKPGFHMNKKYWNSVYLDGSLSNKLIKDMINHSYDEVVKNLTKKQQNALKEKS